MSALRATRPPGPPAGRRLLTAICSLAYGKAGLPYHENPEFRLALENCRRHLKQEELPAPSAPAIAAWFGSEASSPERPELFVFLVDFLNWATSVKILKADAADELREQLDQLIREATSSPKKQRAIGRGAARLGKEIDNLRPIAGTYQIIRPYTSDTEKYVLEIMSINVAASDRNKVLLMYSHTRPEKRYRYSGHLSVNNKYCFGFCTREHEDYDHLQTPRCLVMHVSHQAPCLSGVMLRGVSAITTRKIAIGVPFIAIKMSDMSLLESAELEMVRSNLHKAGEALLVGDVSKTDKFTQRQFEFCDRIFTVLKDAVHNENGLTLQTANQDQLQKALRSATDADATYISAWKNAQQ